MVRDTRPVLVCNPVDDREFAAAAERLLDDGFLALDDFRRQLQLIYPASAVHRREIVAEPVVIWYVYRDGRWVNARSKPDESGGLPVRDEPTR